MAALACVDALFDAFRAAEGYDASAPPRSVQTLRHGVCLLVLELQHQVELLEVTVAQKDKITAIFEKHVALRDAAIEDVCK